MVDEGRFPFVVVVSIPISYPSTINKGDIFMTREEFALKYGRGWWLFQGTPIRHNRRKTWIEQFNTEERARVGKK